MKSTTTGLPNSFSDTISKRLDVTPMYADRAFKAFYIISFLLLNATCNKFTVNYNTNVPYAEWPQIGKNPQHTNFTEERVDFPLELLWSFRAQSAIGTSLITAENLVIFGTLNGRIEGVRLDSGKRSGSIKIKGNHAATCAYVDRSILLVRRRGQPALERYDLNRGRTMWGNKFAGSFCEPLIVENRVYVADMDNELHCVAVHDGTRLWTRKFPHQLHSSPAFAYGLLFLGDDNGSLFAIPGPNGTKWEFRSEGLFEATPAICDSTVYIGSTDQNFFAIDAWTGAEQWRFTADGKIYNGAAVDDRYVVFGTTGHTVYCLDKNSGEKIWTFQAESVISTAPVIADNTVIVGSLDNHLYLLNIDNGEKLTSLEARGRIRTHPIVVKGRLLFASENDRLYCYGKR